VKTREWKNEDGTYNLDTKVTTKLYDTTKKRNMEGRRRRDTALVLTQGGLATILLVNGLAADLNAAIDMMIEVLETYERDFAVYNRTGKGHIYDNLANDTDFPWLGSFVGAPARTVLGIDPTYDTKLVSEYTVDKLKGLI
jgi:hypothetical protein